MKNSFLIALLIGAGLLLMTKKNWTIPAKGMPYVPFFQEAEYRYALPARLTARVADQESDFNPGAYNKGSGARGMMQIIPKWHPGVNVTDLDPRDDIIYAAKYLRENFNRFGSWAKALAAYNWGPGNLTKAIAKHGDNWMTFAPTETRNYVRDVTRDLGIA